MLGSNEHGIHCLNRLNGQIKLILGNHDTNTRKQLYENLYNVEVMPGWSMPFDYNKYHFWLSHHPTITSNMEKSPEIRRHLINLYGHTHQKDKFYQDQPFMFHVGLDSNNNTPILIDDIIEEIKKKVNECYSFL